MNVIGELLGELVANDLGWRIGQGIRSGVIRQSAQGTTEPARPAPPREMR